MDPRAECLPPPVDLVVIPAAEAAALSEMAGRIWPLAYGGLLLPEQIDYMLAWMYDPAKLREEMEAGICFRWIVSGGERVGFLAYGPVAAGEDCPLHKCYLHAEAEGKGIASAAMRRLLEGLAADGAGAVELRVNRGNARAIAFYRRHGFAIDAEDCREIGGGFVMDDFLMRRGLP